MSATEAARSFVSPEGQFLLQQEIALDSYSTTSQGTAPTTPGGGNTATNTTGAASTTASSTGNAATTTPISAASYAAGAPTQISVVQVRYEGLSNKNYKPPQPLAPSSKDIEPSERSSGTSFDAGTEFDVDDTLSTSTSAQTAAPKAHPVPTAFEGKREDDGMIASLFGSGTGSNPKKRQKPKNNITKTNSSFVSRITTHENLTKILANVSGEDTYIFSNIGRTFCWTDLINSPKEPLSRVAFAKAYPTCHDVNQLTRGVGHLDVIIGFSSGDTFWFDPMAQKYVRINKGGAIASSPVTHIRWFPGSENLFMASYGDGSMVIYDKERDDQPFTPSEKDALDGTEGVVTENSVVNGYSHQSRDVERTANIFHVTKPAGNSKQTSKHNPVSHWKVTKKSITSFAFSPDCQHIAVVSQDGCLRVIDFLKEKLLDTFSSYFGALTSVAWSPDGQYIITGGQDDLVTIWAFRGGAPSSSFAPEYQRRIIARCQGHTSWVTGVAFDPWRCDEKNNYRFGSVGEDGKILLWDFSVQALHKPKSSTATSGASIHGGRRESVADRPSTPNAPPGSSAGLSLRREITTNSIRAHANSGPLVHPVLPRSEVAILQPVVVRQIDNEPLKSIVFRQEGIITTCVRGHVKVWSRPGTAT